MIFTREQIQALRLLSSGHVRYGTRIEVMRQLHKKGLCYAHDNGSKGKGRWTWRPTKVGLAELAALRRALGLDTPANEGGKT